MRASEAPRLETARLILRAHRDEDFAGAHRNWTDPDVYRFITGEPSPERDSWKRILNYAGHWKMLGYGFWAIEDRASGDYLGEAGLMDFRRDIDPPLDAPEAGWVLRAPRGQGLAVEAMAEIFSWTDRQPGLARSHCLIHPDNAASIRVAEKLGFGERATIDFMGGPTVTMTRTAFSA
ncbi:MAG: GNAT family N-acetyltransferase [Pseudomonadota bacterium]